MDILYFTNNNRIDYYEIYNNNGVNIDDLSKIVEIPICESPDYDTVAVGPHNNFKTSFSTNVINILHRIGFKNVYQFEHIKLYDVNTSYYIDEMLEKDYSIPFQKNIIKYPETADINDINLLKKYGIQFDIEELELYCKLYSKLNRSPTFVELFDLCQSNSEHSRHWFFKGKLIYNDIKNDIIHNYVLFDMIKSTLKDKNNSLIAFSDNSSVIKGYNVKRLNIDLDTKLVTTPENILDIVLTAETHNFPTLICPFQGASTGIGGRIRDNHATGKGAYLIAGTAGYCVGEIDFKNTESKYNYTSPLNILIEASNGASDYGNKIGEPIISGFTRSFGINTKYERIEWVKPIMFTGGIGTINRKHLYKDNPQENMLVVRIGGPAYKIGLGGGFSSSVDQDGTRKEFELSAVQRGDPQMENKLNRVIKSLIDMEDDNPIVSIHDQGAGGLANVVKEIVYPNGAEIILDNVTLGDLSLHPLEIWCSEFQESDVLLIKSNNIHILERVCKRENVICDVIGTIKNTGNILVKYKEQTILNLPLQDVLEPCIQKEYIMEKFKDYRVKEVIPNMSIESVLEKVLKSIDVCSKRFLTNKVDRSVSGLIVQQQGVGPFETPISNYALVSLGYFDNRGIATSIGERPILGLVSTKSQGSMSVGEMVTNMMGVYIENISNIKCSANWMWAAKSAEEKYRLFKTAEEICNAMNSLNIGIDGGKDSLSMSVKDGNRIIKSPGNIVISGYSSCPDITKRVTPNFKKTNSKIIHISLSDKKRLGGSVFLRQFDQLGDDAPCVEDYTKLKDCFNIIQEYIFEDKILSLHDISDGGLITTISEMCISSNIGVNIKIDTKDILRYLFNEELGIIIEIDKENLYSVSSKLANLNIIFTILGNTTNNRNIKIINKDNDICNIPIDNVSNYWEFTSYMLEKKQTKLVCVNSEYNTYSKLTKDIYNIPLNMMEFCDKCFYSEYITGSGIINKPKVAIIRDEGSNGDREMCAVFNYVGFDTYDIHMNDLLNNPNIIDDFRGIVYVGGFSHSDVLGAAHGWYISIKNNIKLQESLNRFMKRPDTFSLGVCNGCQLMVKQKIFSDKLCLVNNDSGRFESRYATVQVTESDNIFFKNMKNLKFGIWIAHGEGKFINTDYIMKKQKVLRYVRNDEPTIKYPFNPNGSEDGITGVCSKNGRHLAMMPHPERCFQKWQLPYLDTYNNIKTSPWLMMFNNIYNWCMEE